MKKNKQRLSEPSGLRETLRAGDREKSNAGGKNDDITPTQFAPRRTALIVARRTGPRSETTLDAVTSSRLVFALPHASGSIFRRDGVCAEVATNRKEKFALAATLRPNRQWSGFPGIGSTTC